MSKSLKKKKNRINKKKSNKKGGFNGVSQLEPYAPVKRENKIDRSATGVQLQTYEPFQKQYRSDISYYKMTHLDILFRLTYSLFYNINQNFIFNLDNLNPKFFKILSVVNLRTNQLDNQPPELIPVNMSIEPVVSIIESNKDLCLKTGQSFRCLFPEQVSDIIKSSLYFFLTYNFGNNFEEPFFSNNQNSDISMAGRLFRIFIIVLVYVDIDILKKKESYGVNEKLINKEGDLLNDSDLKKSLKLFENIVFNSFVYNIDDYEKLKLFFTESLDSNNNDYFLFPNNYNNYPLIIFLTLFPLRTLINDKYINQHPIEKVLDLMKYKKLFNKGSKNNKIDLNYLGDFILFNKDDVNPLEYSIINCNYIAYKTLIMFIDKNKKEFFNLNIKEKEYQDKANLVSLKIENYIGYFSNPQDKHRLDRMINSCKLEFSLSMPNSYLAQLRKLHFVNIKIDFPKQLENKLRYDNISEVDVNERPLCNRNPHFPKKILINKIIDQDESDLKQIIDNLIDFKSEIKDQDKEKDGNSVEEETYKEISELLEKTHRKILEDNQKKNISLPQQYYYPPSLVPQYPFQQYTVPQFLSQPFPVHSFPVHSFPVQKDPPK